MPTLISKGNLMAKTIRVLLLGLSVLFAGHAPAQQAVDTEFVPSVEVPEYEPGQGPLVLIDAAHLNHDTAEGGYLPFAELLRSDGYIVESNRAPFSLDVLARADILVIANAMHEQSEFEWAPLPSLSAFSDAEIQIVERWVSEGGSLLLIADHMPLSGHASELAAAFGVLFHNGFAYDDDTRDPQITFSEVDSTLPSTVVATGRNDNERVKFVTTFTGQAFRLDPTIDAEPLLVLPQGSILLLPEVAWKFSESTPRIQADYLLQGAIVRHGRGRVAAFGEAAMFGAKLAGPNLIPVGMNSPEARWNQRFATNVMRWLSRAL
jgi:hypothetical protein